MKVYIALPMTFVNHYDPQKLFIELGKLVREYHLEPVLPNDGMNPGKWSELLEKHSFRTASKVLVEHDLALLRDSDAIIALFHASTIGTSMELVYARLWGKVTVVVVERDTVHHPWLWYHADKIIYSTDITGDGVRRACQWLNEHKAPPNS